MPLKTGKNLAGLFFAVVFMNALTTLAFSQDIHKASTSGDFNKVQSLIENDREQVKIKDTNGNTPLHLACQAGHIKIVELLISEGADVNARNNYGRLPLHLAWREKDGARICQILIENGADLDSEDRYGETPLSIAVAVGNKGTLNVLLKHNVKVPIRGEKGRNILHTAASHGLGEFVALMIEKGVDVSTIDNNGGTLLHSAASGGLAELAETLIKQGANVNGPDRYRLSPLHRAASEGHKNVMAVLMANGASIDIENYEGKTPLHLAAEQNLQEIVSYLMSKGAGPDPPKFPVLTEEYLGMKKPGLEPELFAPGIVSSLLTEHSSPVFSPDGKEVYWSSIFVNPVIRRVLFMKRQDGRWTPPRPASFSAQYYCSDPVLSLDGKTLFFYSRRPATKNGEILSGIWFVERNDQGWSEPRRLNDLVDLEGVSWSVSITADGDLFFGATRQGGYGMSDIYQSKLADGKYIKPRNLGHPVNTEYSEGTPVFAPDGSYFIFSGDVRNDGFGGADLSICFRIRDGVWTKAMNMGARINTSAHEMSVSISPDGKYIFFGSFKNGNGDIYWVDAKIIDELKPEELRTKKTAPGVPFLNDDRKDRRP